MFINIAMKSLYCSLKNRKEFKSYFLKVQVKRGKMAIKLEINLTNKWLYSLIAVLIVLALGVGVWAYKSGVSPSVMGHSAEEIEISVGGQTKLLNDCGWKHSGELVYNANSAAAWNDLDLSSKVGKRSTIILLKADPGAGGTLESISFRRKGETSEMGYTAGAATSFGAGVSAAQSSAGNIVYVLVETDDNGITQFKPYIAQDVKIYLEGYLGC